MDNFGSHSESKIIALYLNLFEKFGKSEMKKWNLHSNLWNTKYIYIKRINVQFKVDFTKDGTSNVIVQINPKKISLCQSYKLDPMIVIVSRMACESFCSCTYGRSTILFCAIIDGAYHIMCMVNIHQHSNVYMHHMFILIQNLWAFAP